MRTPKGCVYKGKKKRRARYEAFVLPDGTVSTRKIKRVSR
ncbi:MAG: hypothetical protein Sv326_0493 [Candidatus Fermentimicrarchaeum limneticum]|uniref:Uncharacterized protein n=1 Tax=Fermentimicrarchaeum limneticum TaxID=2795018 RepID=A0A7D5XLI1_FERL1|nr:MAG: hypothetical protein Sv326_0493 [Candidatus Fermentimicrarchaeum limneticum]